MNYTQQSTQELVNECMNRGILVQPEMLSDRDRLIDILTKRKYSVEIVKNYTKKPTKRTVQDFVKYFNSRYRTLSGILKTRKEFQNVLSIGRVKNKKERETVSIIGMVMGLRETSGGHILLQIEDPTGTVDVWIHSKNRELREKAKEIVLDEVMGITGQTAGGRMFASSICWPDVPLTKELKKGHRDAHVAFIGDVEVGSKLFMRKEFEQFLAWLNGDLGNESQRELASKVGYVIFIGDLVHGVGVYPGQQEDSDIHDIKVQYDEFTRLVQKIPSHVQVIVIPGNHDAGRLQEPQLPIYEDFAPGLYSLENVHVLSNPGTVCIEKTIDHPGFDLLLYHGYSLVYYAKEVSTVKDAGGMDAMSEVMKLYLKKRHLAPTHGSNTYVPDPEEDPLVIDKVPDFVVTGHVHNVSYDTYNGTTVINPGCWNDVSDEQIKRGLEPEPARLPIVNLKTRELTIMNFYPGGAK